MKGQGQRGDEAEARKPGRVCALESSIASGLDAVPTTEPACPGSEITSARDRHTAAPLDTPPRSERRLGSQAERDTPSSCLSLLGEGLRDQEWPGACCRANSQSLRLQADQKQNGALTAPVSSLFLINASLAHRACTLPPPPIRPAHAY